jgi:hypothetical protein
MTPTGRIVPPWRPNLQQLPLYTSTLAQWRAQARAAMAFEWEQAELDAREDECLRMFGVTVQYFMDERLIVVDGAVN